MRLSGHANSILKVPFPALDSSVARFDRLVAEYYRSWFRFHPEAAVDQGVSGYDGLLRPYDDDDVGALIALQEKLLNGLEELDPDRLDPDRQIDYLLLGGQARIEHHELLERDWRRRDPLGFLPVHAIYQLTVMAVDDFRSAFEQRLKQIPAYLRGARRHLADMPELIPVNWLEAAVISATAGAQYLRSLRQHPRVRRAYPQAGSLRDLLEGAACALEMFGRFLADELSSHADGEFASGRERFELLLRDRQFLSVGADRLYEFGRRLFDETRKELLSVTRALRGDDDVQALVKKIHADHPAPEALLLAYREQMQTARDFIAEHDLVSMPGSQQFHVVETPVFLRQHIPFAAYLSPAPGEPIQAGHYYVTPVSDEALLGEHNWPGLMHTCVHEAWPGHHLQGVTANCLPAACTLPRLINKSATLYEGWPHYCEQLMQEQGLLALPEQKFILLRDRLWRALGIMLDVQLHTRGLGIDAAVTRIQMELGFSRERALADLHRYSRSPTIPMGNATGWALINAVRDEVLPNVGGLRAFHDRLLSPGSIALPLVIQRAFDEHAWERAGRTVFSP